MGRISIPHGRLESFVKVIAGSWIFQSQLLTRYFYLARRGLVFLFGAMTLRGANWAHRLQIPAGAAYRAAGLLRGVRRISKKITKSPRSGFYRVSPQTEYFPTSKEQPTGIVRHSPVLTISISAFLYSCLVASFADSFRDTVITAIWELHQSENPSIPSPLHIDARIISIYSPLRNCGRKFPTSEVPPQATLPTPSSGPTDLASPKSKSRIISRPSPSDSSDK